MSGKLVGVYLGGTYVPSKLVSGYLLGYQSAWRLGDGGRVSLRRILSPPLCVGSNDLHVYSEKQRPESS